MSKNETNSALLVIAVVAIIIAVCLYANSKEKDNRIKELEEDKLKLILDSLRKNHSFSDEVKRQIEKLCLEYKEIDIKVSNELAQALQLLQINQVENAIEDLVKVMENLLKVHYSTNSEYNSWIKTKHGNKITLHNLLTFCRQENKITDIEFNFFIALKSIRNAEAHELDLQNQKYLNVSGIITAIGGIIRLSNLVYPKKQEEKSK